MYNAVLRRPVGIALAVTLAALVVGFAQPARADHTDPNTPLAPTEGATVTGLTRGEGTWQHIENFPANPGTDLKFFKKGAETYASAGTLGQGDAAHVGQRIIQLTTDKGKTVAPKWVADHGSAACTTRSTGVTSLQHDQIVTPSSNPQLLIDTTDTTGRCHDDPGGGLEFVDISGIHKAGFEPREVHLTRHTGTSHTVSLDATRPWLVYTNNSEFANAAWIDVLDIRSCLNLKGSLEQKRAACRPVQYRIPFEPQWSQARDPNTGELTGGAAGCHDITTRPGRLYCAGLNATLIFDVSNLTDASGAVRGTPVPCTVVDGTRTGAKVSDCRAGAGAPSAEGWQFLGTFNHPGRTLVNNQHQVPADEGVSISHESDPTAGSDYMFVTDERGGGVVPPGASCSPGIDNPYGNGGIHAFDISDPSNISYAAQPDGSKAVWISDAIVPAASFCTVHVIEQLANEQRLSVGYYSQGTKVVDYFVDSTGAITFRETASFILPGANTWAVDVFKTQNNRGEGTRTYYFMASDIQRGIDVFSWTGPINPMGASTPTQQAGVGSTNVVLLLAALVILPGAAWLGRRRRLGSTSLAQ